MAANIDQLSELLGVQIAIDQLERRVGGYELDLLGHVGEGEAVVIVENQLTPTDHAHLGQLITYAAGLEAAIVVWMAAEVRDEHRAAIEWLNQHTTASVSFFLVRPEAFSIDGSKPAVRLQLESAPSEFSRRLRDVVEPHDAPRHEFRRQFWEAMFAYLAEHGHPWAKGQATSKEPWVTSSVGKSGVNCNVSFAQGSRIRVEIYLSSDAAKEQFDGLLAHRSDIEARFLGERVSWERLEDARAARVALYRAVDKSKLADDSSERREVFAWIAKDLTSLRSIARQYLVDG